MGAMKRLWERTSEPPATPTPKSPCQARQYSDQMVCTKCDLGWDVNDPEPPICRKA